MKNQHETPEALAHALFTAAQLAPGEGIEDAVGRLAALVEAHQHARIAELEAQLSSSGFTAADMATASAQGFRDGVAFLSANAGEPVYQARHQKGFWQDSSRERYEYLQNPENTCAKDWETRILYTRPPTSAEGVEHG